MPKLLIHSESDFANASPFRTRTAKKDRGRSAVYAVAALAFLAFVVSMVALALMNPPTF